MQDVSFIDELLQEAESKEMQLTLAHYDLVVAEVGKLTNQIEEVFREADREVQIINDWAINKNAKAQERIEYLKMKLEKFIREQERKTLDLPNGILKIRKKPDKVEVKDLDLFLQNANKEMITVIPESIKPNLSGIKSVIKMSGRVPKGVELIEGQEEFSLKLKEVSNDTKS